ncbi:hypothetical protein [Gemmatimonas sp.]|uniref:hypothetical protein n=1 Tax=Gemmatimonas sp. TaxID=1962908 RepID=UPI00333F0DC4
MAIVIAFNGASGVTEAEATTAVMDLMTEKVHEIRREFRSAVNGLEAITARFANVNGMMQHEADTEFRNLDAQLQQLLTLRQSLQVRVDAHLSQQRIAASVAAHIQQQVA